MKVAVLGYGTVGKGVFEMLTEARGLEQGPDAGCARARCERSSRPTPWSASSWTAASARWWRPWAARSRPFPMCLPALAAGKHVVTANKALVAARGLELARLARESRSGISLQRRLRRGRAFPPQSVAGHPKRPGAHPGRHPQRHHQLYAGRYAAAGSHLCPGSGRRPGAGLCRSRPHRRRFRGWTLCARSCWPVPWPLTGCLARGSSTRGSSISPPKMPPT